MLVSTHFQNFFDGMRNSGTTSPVFFISQLLIHFYPPYEIVFHSCVQQLIESSVQYMINTSVYNFQKP